MSSDQQVDASPQRNVQPDIQDAAVPAHTRNGHGDDLYNWEFSRPVEFFHGHISEDDANAKVLEAGGFIVCFAPRSPDKICLYYAHSVTHTVTPAPNAAAADVHESGDASMSVSAASKEARRVDVLVDVHEGCTRYRASFCARADEHACSATSPCPDSRTFAAPSLPALVRAISEGVDSGIGPVIPSSRYLRARASGMIQRIAAEAAERPRQELMVAGTSTGGALGLGQQIVAAFNPTRVALFSALNRELAVRPSITAIAAGDAHVLACTATGAAYSWGSNVSGALGLGFRGQRVHRPACISALIGHVIMDVAAGAMHSIWLSANGDVFVCGENAKGALGTGSTQSLRTPVALAFFARRPFRRRNMLEAPADSRGASGVLPSASARSLREAESPALFRGSARGHSGQTGSRSSRIADDIRMSDLAEAHADEHDDTLSELKSEFLASRTSSMLTPPTRRREGGSHAASVMSGGGSYHTTTSTVADARAGDHDDDDMILSSIRKRRAREPAVREDGDEHVPTLDDGETLIDDDATYAKVISPIPPRSLHLMPEDSGGDIPAPSWVGAGADETSDESDVIIDVVAGGDTSYAISRLGRVYAWGASSKGQTGTGSSKDVLRPLLLQALRQTRIVRASAGPFHALFVTHDGQLFACGHGIYGRLGLGDDERDRFEPVRVRGPLENKRVVSAAAGRAHSLCATEDGELFAFGDNLHHQAGGAPTGDAAEHADASAHDHATSARVDAGHHALLPTSGVIFSDAHGRTRNAHESSTRYRLPQLISELGGSVITDVAAGDRHSLACTEEGDVFAIGSQCDTAQLGIISGQALRATLLGAHAENAEPGSAWPQIVANDASSVLDQLQRAGTAIAVTPVRVPDLCHADKYRTLTLCVGAGASWFIVARQAHDAPHVPAGGDEYDRAESHAGGGGPSLACALQLREDTPTPSTTEHLNSIMAAGSAASFQPTVVVNLGYTFLWTNFPQIVPHELAKIDSDGRDAGRESAPAGPPEEQSGATQSVSLPAAGAVAAAGAGVTAAGTARPSGNDINTGAAIEDQCEARSAVPASTTGDLASSPTKHRVLLSSRGQDAAAAQARAPARATASVNRGLFQRIVAAICCCGTSATSATDPTAAA